jgi:hypothetical protein
LGFLDNQIILKSKSTWQGYDVKPNIQNKSAFKNATTPISKLKKAGYGNG